MWETLLEILRQIFARMGIDLTKGRTWIMHESPWLNGRRRIVRIGYDGDGHEIGRTVTDETDNQLGRKTTTTIFYAGHGHETGRTVVDEYTDPKGHTTTHSTFTDAKGHVTSSD